jgi:hypothetical protein
MTGARKRGVLSAEKAAVVLGQVEQTIGESQGVSVWRTPISPDTHLFVSGDKLVCGLPTYFQGDKLQTGDATTVLRACPECARKEFLMIARGQLVVSER